MLERRIEIEAGDQLILVDMGANVSIAGWDRADVLVRLPDGQDEDLSVERTEEGPAVSAKGSAELQVPAQLPVTIRQVSANLAIRGLEGTLNAEQVRGNLVLDDVHEATLAEVYGNLRADALSSLKLVGTIYGDAGLRKVQAAELQNVRGNLRVKAADHLRVSRVGGNLEAKDLSGKLDADQVGGNATLKGVAGFGTLEQVAGNLMAKNLTGGAKAARIGGNVMLYGELGEGCTYQFGADGNAILRLAEGAGAHLTLRARGRVLTSAPLDDEQREDNGLTGTLGSGGAEIVVEAKGNVVLRAGEAPVGADLGEEISRQVEESLSAIDLDAIGRQVGEELEQAMSRLRVKLENVDWDIIGRQAQQTVERAMDRMQRDMDRLAEKAKRQQERLERRAERETRYQQRRARDYPRATAQARGSAAEPNAEDEGGFEPPEPNLDDERLSILRMVEQGQITPAEAEMLLDALT
jgi:hypothetical protein